MTGQQNPVVLALEQEVFLYREALRAFTGGKFILASREEIIKYMPKEEPVITTYFNHSEDVNQIKNSVKELLAAREVLPDKMIVVLVCITEALNNAIKYANGGCCQIFLTASGLNAIIYDCGGGINFSILARNSQYDYFSSPKFFGSGFTNMLKFLDRVTMATSNKGTILILSKENLFL